MLVTLIPLFDENMTVKAYSIFTQKKNFLLSPSMLGTGMNDGAGNIDGLEVIQSMGIETLSSDKEVFVSLNNISVFADISSQCNAPHERLVLLFDNTVKPDEVYIARLKELKEMGYKLAIRKLGVQDFEEYQKILELMDYILLDSKKIDLQKAKQFFNKYYPKLGICAGNIENQEGYEGLCREGGFVLYEGSFFRVPVTQGIHEVAPLKVNYIQLLNLVNNKNFELTQAADIIGRDTSLTISLLKMVNRMAINSEITSIRHAAAMLGQKELKKWINTAVAGKLYADKPSEITRLSLLRAKFAENLAPAFSLAGQSSELFLMGLFSVLDIILEMPMEEALEHITVSKNIRDALIAKKGPLSPIMEFVTQYEFARWEEVSRLMVLQNITVGQAYEAYIEALTWYRDFNSYK